MSTDKTTLRGSLAPEVRAYLSQLGTKGGTVKSPAKTAAARANAKKPRKR